MNCKTKKGGIAQITIVSEETLKKAVEEERYEMAQLIKEVMDGKTIWHSFGFGITPSMIKEENSNKSDETFLNNLRITNKNQNL